QRPDHERMAPRHELSKVGIRGAIDEQMCQAVGARIDCIARSFERPDVRYCQFPSFVCCGDNRGHCLLAYRRNAQPVGSAVIIDDLYVVRPLGYSGVYKGLSLVRAADGWNLDSVFGPVAAWRGDERSGRKQIGRGLGLSFGLLLSDSRGHMVVGEHV